MVAPNFKIVGSWEEATNSIILGKSVFISAPKNFGKDYYFNKFIADRRITSLYKIAILRLPGKKAQLDLALIFNTLIPQLYADKQTLKRGQTYEGWFSAIAARKKFVLVIPSTFENRYLVIELINWFQEIARQDVNLFINNPVILLLDDYSLYFYEMGLKEGASFWDFFRDKIRVFQINEMELAEKLKSRDKGLGAYARTIYSLTGGHHGLVHKAIELLLQKKVKPDLQNFETECTGWLLQTGVVESIKTVLLAADEHFFLEALRFQEKRFTDLEINEATIRLHQSGIVIKKDMVFSILCPGIVRSLVEQIYQQRFGGKPVVTSNVNGHTPGATKVRALKQKEIFFSYAWDRKEALVKRLYEELNKIESLRPILDKADLQRGQFISEFMKRIGKGKLIIVLLSDKYLKSVFCMYELYEIFRNSKLESGTFRKRVYLIRLQELRLGDPKRLNQYLQHWTKEKEKWDRHVKKWSTQMNKKSQEDYERVKNIYNCLSELLGFINDINSPKVSSFNGRNFEEVKKDILALR